jgi:hypothetical protein
MAKRNQRGHKKHSDILVTIGSDYLLAEPHHDLTQKEGRNQAVEGAQQSDDNGDFLRVLITDVSQSTVHLDAILRLDDYEERPRPNDHDEDEQEEEKVGPHAPCARHVGNVCSCCVRAVLGFQLELLSRMSRRIV